MTRRQQVADAKLRRCFEKEVSDVHPFHKHGLIANGMSLTRHLYNHLS